MKRYLLASPLLLAACATHPPAAPPAPPPPTVAPTPVEQPLPRGPRTTRAEALKMLMEQNEQALELPTLVCMDGKGCAYNWEPGLHYWLPATTCQQSLITLERGEIPLKISQPGKQARISTEINYDGTGRDKRYTIGIMPRTDAIRDQVSIYTSRKRRYDLQIEVQNLKLKRGQLCPEVKQQGGYSVEIKWNYPSQSQPEEDPNIDRTTGFDVRRRNCNYQISASDVPWKPVPTADDQPPVCDQDGVTVINFAPDGLLGGSPNLSWIKPDGVPVPVDAKTENATYRINGVYDHLRLSFGAYEVHIVRGGVS